MCYIIIRLVSYAIPKHYRWKSCKDLKDNWICCVIYVSQLLCVALWERNVYLTWPYKDWKNASIYIYRLQLGSSFFILFPIHPLQINTVVLIVVMRIMLNSLSKGSKTSSEERSSIRWVLMKLMPLMKLTIMFRIIGITN